MKYFKIYYGLSFISAVVLFSASQEVSCRADDSSNQPVLHLEDAVVIPHGDTISCYGLPVVTPATGSNAAGIKTYDVEIHLAIGADGALHADSVKMTPTPVLPASIDHFVPGEYVTVPDPTGTVTATGPVEAPGGRQIWTYVAKNVSISGVYGASSLLNGTWFSGPLEGNPQLLMLPKGAILPKNFTFGRDSQENLIGVQQLGDKLVIARFNRVKDSDPAQFVVLGSCILQRKPPKPN
jgi:hypothetical protein